MAENKFMQFIPPQLRGPATDVGIFGRVASDNILGFLDNYFLGNRFDDDYESTGEQLGTAFREQPIETGKALGTGIYEAGKSVYEDPKAAFGSALEGLEGVFDRLNTPYDQLDLSTEEAQRERAGDLAILGEALGGAGIITKSLAKLTKKQLRERVARENPGLNEDQVNSIVEDTGYDPSIPPELDPFRDVYDPVDDGRRSPALVETGGFPMQVVPENTVPPNMEVPTVEGFEGIPIVTAGGRVIGSVLDPEQDVDGNLYGPPDTFDERALLAARADLDDAPPPGTFDELVELGIYDPDDELARLETMLPEAQVAERVAARSDAVAEFLSQRGLSPILAREALAENNRPILMQELREFVSQRTQQTLPSESEIFSRIESLNSVPDFPDELIALPREAIEVDEDEIMDAILVDEAIEDLLADDDADVPLTAAQEAAFIPATNTNIQGFDTTWLTRPGYGRFTDDANTPVETRLSEPAELAAGDIKLTGENSYLTSRMDTALSELSQSQTKFASLEQLVNTLTKKYGVQLTELQARGIPTSQVEADLLFTNNFTPKPDFDFSKDKVDLNDPFYQNILNKDPFVVRTLGGADAAYPGEFTKGVTNYKVTIIGLENRPDLLKQGVMDNDHLMGHQMMIDGPTVVHIRTGEFPVQGGGYDRKKTFHLGEIQSQVEKNSRPSRKANDLVRDVAKKMELPEDLEFRIPEGFSINQLAEDLQSTANKIKDVRQLREIYEAGDTDALEKYFDSSTTFGYDGPKMVKSYAEITGITEADSYKRMAQARLVRISSEINKAFDKYNIYKKGSDEVHTSGSSFLDDFEKTLVQTYNKRELNFLDPDETGPGDFLQDLMKFGGENFNASDYGVGSIFTTDRVTRMGIKEALQQAVDTDADFFTLGTGQMAKDMTYGKLSGQKEYYDEIVPKTFKKIMKEIFKDTGIKPPKLIKRKMETLDEYGENVVTRLVPGIELTDELREIFKSKKVQAFKEGGLAKLSSSLRPKLRPGTQLRRPKLRPGTLEALREKMYLAGPPINDRQIERDKQTKGFGDLEYRAELEPQFSYNPIARLGYDPDIHRVVKEPQGIEGYRQGFGTAFFVNRLGESKAGLETEMGLSPEDAARVEQGDIVTSANLSVSPIISHEFTHRGFQILRKERDKDPEAFDEKYGEEAGKILEITKFKPRGSEGESTEEYYVEMFDDLNTRFNTSYEYVDQDYEDFPKNTIRSTVQSSFLGPRYMLMDREPIYENRRRDQIQAFQDVEAKGRERGQEPGYFNYKGGDGVSTSVGILGLMDAAQDILTERGEPPKTKPRLKEENLNFFQKIGKAIGLKDGGLAALAKEVL